MNPEIRVLEQSVAPVALKRDLRGFLLYWAGAPAAVYLITVTVLTIGLISGRGVGVGVLTILGFFCVLCFPWFLGRTIISDGVLSCGIRWFPREIQLADIKDVYVTKIWVFGGQVRGLCVVLHDGSKTGLPLSAWMGETRLNDWKRSIRRCADIEPAGVE